MFVIFNNFTGIIMHKSSIDEVVQVVDFGEDTVRQEVSRLNIGDGVRFGPYVVERRVFATAPQYVVEGEHKFTVRKTVYYAPSYMLERGMVSADRLRELAVVAVVGEFYALVYDMAYNEYARLYEDGHMTQLQREDCVKLHRMGVM